MSNWSPDPSGVVIQFDTGTGDMGSVADDGLTARFGLEDRPWVLVFIRAHFSLGTGTANMYIKLNSRLGPYYDVLLNTRTNRGVGADDFFRVDRDEYEKWIFQPGDYIVCEWTNPDSGDLAWGLEVGIADAGS
jgi:hypothetical protein